MMVKRFTTFVMAIRPTFCEKDVTGGHPNRVDTAEQYPSQAREPEISLPVISRFKPPDTRAEVSPMVSAADTRKIIQADMMAPAWNSGIKGSMVGKAMIPPDMIRLKSTFPRKMAITYPTISPARTESCFKYPFARIFHKRQVSSVTVPNIRFSAEPKSSA